MRDRMNKQFKDIKGGLFSTVTKADVGGGVAAFLESGGANMAWADPFYPDASLPESVKNAMREALEEGKISHYVMPIGDEELRKTVSEMVNGKTGLNLDPFRNVIITPGSDSALIFAMMPFIAEGDEVLIPDPSYPSNALNVKILGGTPVSVPLYESENYQINIEEFKKRVTDKTKMVVITHPNNPTTTVFRREGMEELCKFIVENDLILVSDQAFEDHIYDDVEFVYPATLPGMWERTLTVCSISKGLGLSGLRIGYIYADDVIMDALYGSAVNVIGASNTLATVGAIAAIKDKQYMSDIKERLYRRRNLTYEILGDIPGTIMKPSESGILAWINVEKLGSADDVAAYIMEHAKIMVNSGVPYGAQGEGHIRFVSACYASDEEAGMYLKKIRKALIDLGKEKGIS